MVYLVCSIPRSARQEFSSLLIRVPNDGASRRVALFYQLLCQLFYSQENEEDDLQLDAAAQTDAVQEVSFVNPVAHSETADESLPPSFPPRQPDAPTELSADLSTVETNANAKQNKPGNNEVTADAEEHAEAQSTSAKKPMNGSSITKAVDNSEADNRKQLKKQKDVIAELEEAVKREVAARKVDVLVSARIAHIVSLQELEDMLMRMERHLHTEEEARKNCERQLEESLQNELQLRKEFDAVVRRQQDREAEIEQQILKTESVLPFRSKPEKAKRDDVSM